MKKYYTLAFLILSIHCSFGQLVRFSFVGATGSPVTFPADTQPTDGSVTDFSRGAGLGTATSTDNFGANNWTTATSPDLTDYFAFTVTANGGFVLNLTSLELDEIRTGTGPQQWVVRSSLDGFTANLGSFTNTGTSLLTNRSIPLSSSFYNQTGSIEFRIYAFQATGGTGVWRVDNVEVFGSISAPDATPPTLQSASTLLNNQLDVFFNESVSQASAENIANYSLNGGIGTPLTATRNLGNFSQVTLTFATPFVNNQNYTVTASNIVDFASNTQSSTQTNFTFLQISNAVARDLIINEIMADETPQVGLPASEYVEIYNKSDKNINLKNYTLNTRTITTSNYILPVGSYVLLCPQANTGLFTGNVLGVASWDALTNTGETITLRDVDNALDVDAVTYATSWYKDSNKDDGGWSLELVNPSLPCSDENNWRASNATSGGTPSQQNSVFNNTPDTQKPTVTSSSIVTSSIVRIVFSETMNQASLLAGNYTVSGGIGISNVSIVSEREVQLTLDAALLAGDTYTITISNVNDCAGNQIIANTTTQVGVGLLPSFNQVIITEIFADPEPRVGLPEQEYLELYNRTNKVISLNGCKISDNTSSATLPSINILPNQYILLVNSSVLADFSAYSPVVGVASLPSLNNSGERLTLRGADGKLVFTVTYSDSWYNDAAKKEGGWALEMIDTENPCTETGNWAASTNAAGGTPTQVNSVKETKPDNIAPKLLRVDAIDNQTIVLNFNEKLDSLSAASANYSVDKGIVVQSKTVVSPDFKQIVLTVNPLLQNREQYRITVQSLTDCSGNLIGEVNFADFGVPEQADSTDIILNEVLFNPRTGGSDFVELYNQSDKYINLKNWSLARLVNNAVDSKHTITTDNYVLAPKSYVAVSTDILNIQSNYPLFEGKPFLQASSMPSYNDDEGIVLVINNLERIMERFDYKDDFHFELLDDEEGVSLERLGFELPTNNPSSWFSAASSVGFATPAYANSQNKINQAQSGAITIVPKVFTPDNDGQADFTTINYKLAGQGNVANVSIYDAQGRLIKHLARNQTLANEGFLIWDGANEDRTRVRTGYYIVLFQVFDLTGRQETYKETVAVTHKD